MNNIQKIRFLNQILGRKAVPRFLGNKTTFKFQDQKQGFEEKLKGVKEQKINKKNQQYSSGSYQEQQSQSGNNYQWVKILLGCAGGILLGQFARQYFSGSQQGDLQSIEIVKKTPEQIEEERKQQEEKYNSLNQEEKLAFILEILDKNEGNQEIYRDCLEKLKVLLESAGEGKENQFFKDKITLTLGNCHINLGQYKQAMDLYENVQQYQEGMFYKAICLQETNERKQAAIILEDLVEKYDEFGHKVIPKGYIMEILAEIYKQLRQLNLALDMYDDLIKIDVKNDARNLRFYMNKAVLFYQLDQYPESIDCCEKIQEIDPENQTVKDLQKRITMQAKRLLSAQEDQQQ